LNLAQFNIETGLLLEEPHDDNIFVDEKSQSLKYCDPLQIKEGSLDEAVYFFMMDANTRPECYRFANKFREGLAEGISLVTDKTVEDAYSDLNFIKKYNDIF